MSEPVMKKHKKKPMVAKPLSREVAKPGVSSAARVVNSDPQGGPRQLELWWTEKNGKQELVVVLQSDMLNRHADTTLVAPVLAGEKFYAFSVNVTPTPANGLDHARYIHLRKLQEISMERLVRQAGTLEAHYLEDIRLALGVVFGVNLGPIR